MSYIKPGVYIEDIEYVTVRIELTGRGKSFMVQAVFEIGEKNFYLNSDKIVKPTDMAQKPYTIEYNLSENTNIDLSTAHTKIISIDMARELWQVMCEDGFYSVVQY